MRDHHARTGKDRIITVDRVSIAYGREEVLHDVSFEVGRGEFLPFIGANGSGKTTLLRAILGLIRPKTGSITTPFSHSPPGYVPQQKSIDPLYPVSVRQIVSMGLYPQLGIWRRQCNAQRELVDGALDRFGLLGHASKAFNQLSGGMKQKALIARALVSGSQVLVMDEPASELDEQSEGELLRLLLGLCEHEGKTVLAAYHGLSRVAALASRICLVERRTATIISPDRAEAKMNSFHDREESGGS